MSDQVATAFFVLLDRWKAAVRHSFALHPVSTVTSFDDRWPWLLTSLLIAETRAAVHELREIAPACRN